MKISDQFTNKYEITKTLRFDLIPEKGTNKLVRNLLDDPEKEHHQSIENDLQLAKSYKNVKQLIDCQHRNIIDETLANFNFTNDELKKLEELNTKTESENDENNITNKKKKFLSELRTKISKKLNEHIKFNTNLLNPNGKNNDNDNKTKKKKGKCELEKWLDTADEKYLELPNNDDNEKFDKEDFRKDIKIMQGFFTYFKDFKENRENVYSAEEISTAIPYRIVNDNFPIFKKNIDLYKKIKTNSDYKELAALIDEKGAGEIFQLDYFNKCLTQEGIDIYNNEKLGIIAKEQGTEQEKGINQIINEYVQQKNKEIKDNAPKGEKPKKIKIPVFDKLKKQILSINKTKSFKFKILKNTKEIIESINERYEFLTRKKNNKANIVVDEIKTFLGNIANYELDKIFLNERAVGNLSLKLFGQGGYIKSALEKFYDDDDNIKKDEKDKQKFLSHKQFSISLINNCIKHYLDKYEQEQNVKDKYKNCENIIVDYFKNPTITIESEDAAGETIYENKNLFDELKIRRDNINHILDKNKNYNKDLKDEKESGGDGEKIKAFLDALLELNYILNPFIIKDKNIEKDEEFYNEIRPLQEALFEAEILDIYNQTRNYITQKPYKLNKFRLMFDNPQFADGWPSTKEGDYKVTILRYRDEYKLLIIPDNKLDYSEAAVDKNDDYYEKMFYDQMADPTKDIPNLMVDEKGKTVRKTGRKEKEGEFEGQNLQLEDAKNKLLPDDINEIRKNKSYSPTSENFNSDDLKKYIDYYKQRVIEYKDKAKFVFKDNYKSFSEFTNHVDEQAYQLNFDTKISKKWIDKQVQDGKLFLFKIHSKDFNAGSKGNKNLHTLYWKMLFDPKNLENVVFKLNGGAKLFYRDATHIKNNTIHKSNDKVPRKFFERPDGTLESVPEQSIKNLNRYFRDNIPIEKWNESDKKYKDNFSVIGEKENKIGIIKDERFTKDKIQFHCSITMNFKSENKNRIDDDVLGFLYKRDDVHIIGLDRGERNLIYLTMINKEGKIVDGMQFSLNELERKYAVNGIDKVQKINYQKLLEKKGADRIAARKNWHTIENIKELKEGYLSLVIHQLAKLILEKNAIIVMEDLTYGLKDSRAKVEKQVYQKFENMLIKKLQFLVTDKNNLYEEGGVLMAYQLTNEDIPPYKYMNKQNGFLFYVPPDYTSKIDPVTGFINLLDTRYTNRKNAIDLFNRFDKIYYDTKNKYFRFNFDYKKFGKLRIEVNELKRTKWSVCSHHADRVIATQKNNRWERSVIDVNTRLENLFKEHNIDFSDGQCLKESICQIENAKFFEELLKNLFVLLSLRHNWKRKKSNDEYEEHDTIISSVELIGGSNEFYNSENEKKKGVDKNGKWKSELPVDADANGAYNIARKGLWLLKELDKAKNKEEAVKNFNKMKESKYDKVKKKRVSQWCPNSEWLKFVQEKE
ncbi:MAG: type V CRISPR-associated protein Cas12a/Cpf1 [Planctomycetaceae bacterium]|jgi:CRISPR-associated protein Cpf1|nr:type V CRISPR-associated protein Cas12a/Cpf1 [Planctomycetaceae bacterium]